MARLGLERRIKSLELEINNIKFQIHEKTMEIERITTEALAVYHTPSPFTQTSKSTKKKPVDLRISLLKRSSGVKEYESMKKTDLDREKERFELEKLHRIEALESQALEVNRLIQSLELDLRVQTEEYERLVAHSSGKLTGRGRKPKTSLKKI